MQKILCADVCLNAVAYFVAVRLRSRIEHNSEYCLLYKKVFTNNTEAIRCELLNGADVRCSNVSMQTARPESMGSTAASDLHGGDADGEVEGHGQVYPPLPPAPQPGVDQAIPFSGLPKAGRPKDTHGAIHHTRHPCRHRMPDGSRREKPLMTPKFRASRPTGSMRLDVVIKPSTDCALMSCNLPTLLLK